MARKIVIADYGLGNIRSISNALKAVTKPEQEVLLGDNSKAIEFADHLILPGVGAFAECKRKLENSGLLESIFKFVESGRPLLGICVGMQILADRGSEHGDYSGLSLVPGIVRKIQLPKNSGEKLPHVGWTPVSPIHSQLFKGILEGSHFYFVHSFIFSDLSKEHWAALAHYGENFPAAVVRENVFGCQFHPEKSSHSGLQLLQNFCQWDPL